MKPRRLSYLRVNDKVPTEWGDLARLKLPVDVTDLRYWFSFCKDLAAQELLDYELLTLDINFADDSSGPFFPLLNLDPKTYNKEFLADPLLYRLQWPDTLVKGSLGQQGPNSGLLIGAQLVSLAVKRDLPCGVAFHTEWPQIVMIDMPSAMLATQILLASRALNQADDLHETMHDAVELITKSAHVPLLGIGDAVVRFRHAFLERAGARVRSNETPVRLWMETVSLWDLLNIFMSVQSEDELDAKLETAGIDFHDRGGIFNSLDVRSVFLDEFMVVDADNRLEGLRPKLPLATVKPPAGGQVKGGVVWEFVKTLATETPANISPVLEFFGRLKAGKETGNINQLKRTTHRLIALIFAWMDLYAEWWFDSESGSFNAVKDEFDHLDFSPLASQIKELLRIINLAGDQGWRVKEVTFEEAFDPRVHFLPLSGPRSVSSLLRQYCVPQSALFKSLHYVEADSDRSGQNYATALNRLLAIAEKWECIEKKEDRQGKSYFRLKWTEIPQRRPVRFKHDQIAEHLGFNLEGEKDPSNQLTRIIQKTPGYEKVSLKDFLLSLEERPLVDHFKRLGWRFIDEFWGEDSPRPLPREAWPLCLSDMKGSSGDSISLVEWAQQMERSHAAALRTTLEIVPAEFSLIVNGCDIHCRRKFADELGGDYYRVKPDQGSKLRLYIGDVCGKGVAASLVVHEIHALITAFEDQNLSPDQMCSQLDSKLGARLSAYGQLDGAAEEPTTRWATFVCAVLDLESWQLTYANAGHPAPLIVHGDGRVTALLSQSVPVGILQGIAYRVDSVPITPGDRLVFYTDGFADGPEQKLLQTLETNRNLGAKDLVNAILTEVKSASGGLDDITILVVAIPSSSAS